MPYIALPGSIARGGPTPRPALVFPLLFLVALLAGGAYVIRQTTPANDAAEPPVAAGTPGAVPEQAPVGGGPAEELPLFREDLRLHLEHLKAKLLRLREETVKSQELIRTAAANLDRPAQERDVRRLMASDTHLGAARAEIEESLDVVEIISVHFAERRER